MHKEKGKPDEVVVLGMFNIDEHIKWLSRNPEKKPKFDATGKKQVISHFYSWGSLCQRTGEKRETEVNNKDDNYSTVIIYNNPYIFSRYVISVSKVDIMKIQ